MDYIDGDKPLLPGLYVAYTNGPSDIAAERVMLVYLRGWYYPMSDQRYREHIYGFIGPLPVLRLDK